MCQMYKADAREHGASVLLNMSEYTTNLRLSCPSPRAPAVQEKQCNETGFPLPNTVSSPGLRRH